MILGKRKFFMLSLLLFLSCSGIGLAQEPTYTVSQTQLNAWMQGLNQLKENNEELKKLSTERSKELTLLKEQLTESQKAIDEAMIRQQTAEQSLNDLNNYWKKYKDSNQRTEKRLERQRDTWAVIAGIILATAVSK